MNWQTNPAMIGLRNVARKTGVIQFINQFLPRKKNYEQAFDTAIEPFPATAARLRAELTGVETVTVLPVALGAETGTVSMREGDDELGATNRIVEGGAGESKVIRVDIATGDSIFSRGLAAAPAIIKIDTEGFELDVLNGMQEILNRATLRAVFIEVHFAILAERGLSAAPGRIERLLSEKASETAGSSSRILRLTVCRP